MDTSWVWTISAITMAVLVVGLVWAQVRQRRSTQRRTGVDWPAAITVQLTVIAAAVESLMLIGVVYGGPPATRFTAALLPRAAVAVIGFAASIALLAVHRRVASGRPGLFDLRRLAVVVPGALGFVALASMTQLTMMALGHAMAPAVVSVFAGPALTALLGLVLATYLIAVALVPRQSAAAVAPVVDAQDERTAEEASIPVRNLNSIETVERSDAERWNHYRRPGQ